MQELTNQILAAAARHYQQRVADTYGFDVGETILPQIDDEHEILFLLCDDLIAESGYGLIDFYSAHF